MDTQYYLKIAKEIENDNYFKESRKWFSRMYLSVYTQYIYFFIISSIFGIVTFLTYTIALENYETKNIPFAIYASDTTKEYPKISALSQKGDSMISSIARYMAIYYVKLREDYYTKYSEEEGYNEYLKKVQNISSMQVFNEFINQIDPKLNSESVITQYRDTIIRKSKILNVEFLPYQGKPDAAIIQYETKEFMNNKPLRQYKYSVEIIFDIDIDKNLHNINFVVLRYKYTI